MFVVLLKFAGNTDQASKFGDGHRERLDRGFEDGVFLRRGAGT